MPPHNTIEDSSGRPQTDYERWVTEQYGREPDSASWKLSDLYQVLMWNEGCATFPTNYQPGSPYHSVRLSCREQSTILVIVSGHLMVLLVLLHLVRGKKRRLDVIGAWKMNQRSTQDIYLSDTTARKYVYRLLSQHSFQHKFNLRKRKCVWDVWEYEALSTKYGASSLTSLSSFIA